MRQRLHATTGDGFTLIELLVTISMITLLVALLLPALQKARDSSIKAQCLSNKRQLNIATIGFATDNRMLMPTGMTSASYSSSKAQNRYINTGLEFSNGLHTQYGGTEQITPQGTLAVLGYVDSIDLYFCGGFDRSITVTPGTNPYRNWYPNLNLTGFWNPLRAGATLPSPGTDVVSGSVILWYADITPGTGLIPGTGNFRYDMQRLDYIESYWNTKSPFQVGGLALSRSTYSPALWADSNVGNSPYTGVRRSHIGSTGLPSGLNCAFFDGSARWVSREEILTNNPIQGGLGSNDFLSTDDLLLGSFGLYSRRQLKMVKAN